MKYSIGVAAALTAAAVTGCGSGDANLVGVARMRLNSVPGDVQCISLAASGSRFVRQDFPVTPNQPVLLEFGGIPTGEVTFTGDAYSVACSAINTTNPSWSSNYVTTEVDPGVTANVHLVFVPNGGVNVDVDFEGGSTSTPQCAPTMWGTFKLQVASHIQLPQQRTDFALDLNGDGRVDNGYGNITGALSSQGIDVQTNLNAAVAAGDDLLLVTEASSDPSFGNDPCAGATLAAGVKPATPPSFDGTDHLTVDSSVAPALLTGPLTSGSFASSDPSRLTTAPQTVTVTLPFGTALVRVPLIGARLTLPVMGSAQLNGAIRASDVQSRVVPGIAASFNAQIAAAPSSSSSLQLLSIFDTGGQPSPACNGTCQNPDGVCAVQGDKILSVCEIATSGLIQNLLAPDVQMFAADGSYQPNPANTSRDSLSVGLSVDFVRATF